MRTTEQAFEVYFSHLKQKGRNSARVGNVMNVLKNPSFLIKLCTFGFWIRTCYLSDENRRLNHLPSQVLKLSFLFFINVLCHKIFLSQKVYLLTLCFINVTRL